MSEPIIKTDPAKEPETTPEQTFSQAEVDAMIGKRLAIAMKGMPGKEELSEFRTWKESQQSEKEKLEALTRERDEGKTALADALARVEQYEREKLLLSKGVSAEDVDYYAYKIGQKVTETVSFEKAMEAFLKEKGHGNQGGSTVRVDFSAPLGGGKQQPSANETMNSILRGWRK